MQRIQVEQDTRAARAASLARQLDGLYSGEAVPSDWVGGRAEALRRLNAFDAHEYARGRNFTVGGVVSQLSAYIRHGAVSLAEVRDFVVRKFPRHAIEKFVAELAWRAFWRSVYASTGRAIRRNMEPPKYVLAKMRRIWDTKLPDEVAQAQTGLECIDAGLRQLFSVGYVHNHWRMWFAAWLTHWRRVDWRVGAQLFEQHLLDGDPASNALSWQWVAGTFSHKPYFFNRENVEKFSRGVHCKICPAAQQCPFEGSYEDLAETLGIPREGPK